MSNGSKGSGMAWGLFRGREGAELAMPAGLPMAAGRQRVRARRDAALVFEQVDQLGVRSLSIVNLTALFMGMVLALQMGNFLAKFGAQIFVSRIVGVSLLREMRSEEHTS